MKQAGAYSTFYSNIKYDKKHTNVVFTCNGTTFECNSCIVSISQTLKEKILANNLVITEITPIQVDFFLKNVYNFGPEKQYSLFESLELYISSKVLKCPFLYQGLFTFLSKSIKYDNALDILETLYKYFMDKDELFYEVMNFVHTNLDLYIDDKSSKLGKLPDDLRIACLVSFERELKHQRFAKTRSELLTDHMKYLRKSCNFADMTIKCKNGQIPCHRLILEAESEVFQFMNEFDVEITPMYLYLDWLYSRCYVPPLDEQVEKEFESLFQLTKSQLDKAESVIKETFGDEEDMGLDGLFNQ